MEIQWKKWLTLWVCVWVLPREPKISIPYWNHSQKRIISPWAWNSSLITDTRFHWNILPFSFSVISFLLLFERKSFEWHPLCCGSTYHCILLFSATSRCCALLHQFHIYYSCAFTLNRPHLHAKVPCVCVSSSIVVEYCTLEQDKWPEKVQRVLVHWLPKTFPYWGQQHKI